MTSRLSLDCVNDVNDHDQVPCKTRSTLKEGAGPSFDRGLSFLRFEDDDHSSEDDMDKVELLTTRRVRHRRVVHSSTPSQSSLHQNSFLAPLYGVHGRQKFQMQGEVERAHHRGGEDLLKAGTAAAAAAAAGDEMGQDGQASRAESYSSLSGDGKEIDECFLALVPSSSSLLPVSETTTALTSTSTTPATTTTRHALNQPLQGAASTKTATGVANELSITAAKRVLFIDSNSNGKHSVESASYKCEILQAWAEYLSPVPMTFDVWPAAKAEIIAKEDGLRQIYDVIIIDDPVMVDTLQHGKTAKRCESGRSGSGGRTQTIAQTVISTGNNRDKTDDMMEERDGYDMSTDDDDDDEAYDTDDELGVVPNGNATGSNGNNGGKLSDRRRLNDPLFILQLKSQKRNPNIHRCSAAAASNKQEKKIIYDKEAMMKKGICAVLDDARAAPEHIIELVLKVLCIMPLTSKASLEPVGVHSLQPAAVTVHKDDGPKGHIRTRSMSIMLAALAKQNGCGGETTGQSDKSDGVNGHNFTDGQMKRASTAEESVGLTLQDDVCAKLLITTMDDNNDDDDREKKDSKNKKTHVTTRAAAAAASFPSAATDTPGSGSDSFCTFLGSSSIAALSSFCLSSSSSFPGSSGPFSSSALTLALGGENHFAFSTAFATKRKADCLDGEQQEEGATRKQKKRGSLSRDELVLDKSSGGGGGGGGAGGDGDGGGGDGGMTTAPPSASSTRSSTSFFSPSLPSFVPSSPFASLLLSTMSIAPPLAAAAATVAAPAPTKCFRLCLTDAEVDEELWKETMSEQGTVEADQHDIIKTLTTAVTEGGQPNHPLGGGSSGGLRGRRRRSSKAWPGSSFSSGSGKGAKASTTATTMTTTATTTTNTGSFLVNRKEAYLAMSAFNETHAPCTETRMV